MNNSNEQPSFSDWFSLADGRKNFKTSPIPDKSYLLGEPSWEKEIDTDLKKSTLLGTPVHLPGGASTASERLTGYATSSTSSPPRTILSGRSSSLALTSKTRRVSKSFTTR